MGSSWTDLRSSWAILTRFGAILCRFWVGLYPRPRREPPGQPLTPLELNVAQLNMLILAVGFFIEVETVPAVRRGLLDLNNPWATSTCGRGGRFPTGASWADLGLPEPLGAVLGRSWGLLGRAWGSQEADVTFGRAAGHPNRGGPGPPKSFS